MGMGLGSGPARALCALPALRVQIREGARRACMEARGRAPTKKMPRRAATQRDAAAWAVRFVAAPRKGNHPVVAAAPRGPSQGAGVALEILAGPDPKPIPTSKKSFARS